MNFVQLRIVLGYLGFLPFALFTILPMIFGDSLAIWSLKILSIYGGVILSFLAGMTWGWQQENLKKLDLQIGILFSLLGFFIVLLTENFLLYAMILNSIAFPLFYSFEKRRNIFFREEDYKKLRLFLTGGVSGCFLFGFLNFF
tara:strand:- start:24 stop:452 length:429 start_codon:yes stop_codon:yes gene_type:complete